MKNKISSISTGRNRLTPVMTNEIRQPSIKGSLYLDDDAMTSDRPNGYTPAVIGLTPNAQASANAAANTAASFFVTFIFFFTLLTKAVSIHKHPFSFSFCAGEQYNTNRKDVLVEVNDYFFVFFLATRPLFGRMNNIIVTCRYYGKFAR